MTMKFIESKTKFVTLFTLFSFYTNLVLAYTPPSNEAKFQHVLERAKLQAPDSSTSESNLFGYASSYFTLQDGRYIQFETKGQSKRSELREMEIDGDKAAWSVLSLKRLHAEIAVPRPDEDLDEITILQIHCGVKPALRISWRRTYEENGVTYSDCIISNVREGLGGSDTVKKFLAERSSRMTSYDIRVNDGKLNVWIGGDHVLNEASLHFWEEFPTCYFKAGVYINHVSSDSATARTEFEELYWF